MIGSKVKNGKGVDNYAYKTQRSIIMRLKTKKPLINLRGVDIIGVKKD